MPHGRAPNGTFRPKPDELPVTMVRFVTSDDGLPAAAAPGEPAPQIIFPPDGAHVDLTSSGGAPLMLKLQGGRAPFRWLANGKPPAMPPWRDKVSDEDVKLLWAYVRDGG